MRAEARVREVAGLAGQDARCEHEQGITMLALDDHIAIRATTTLGRPIGLPWWCAVTPCKLRGERCQSQVNHPNFDEIVH